MDNNRLKKLITKKKSKSNSGVVVITILTSGSPEYIDDDGKKVIGKFSCKHNCAYCPNEKGHKGNNWIDQPRSYLYSEPAVLRANENNFDPILQFNSRVDTLIKMGHVVDKLELIVLGGTWSNYHKNYKDQFIREIYYAANTYYLRNRYTVDVDHPYGIFWNPSVDYSYAIFRQTGGWSHPYPDLHIAFHTGIKLGAHYSYNGIRFYNNSDFATITASIGDGDNHMRGYYDIIAYASDKRLKHNIQPIENALAKVNSLNGMTYQWNELGRQHGWEPDMEIREAGVFAQDVQVVLPEAVRLAPFDNDKGVSKSGENFLTVKYEKIVPLLIEAIKEQQTQIEELKSQISYLVDNK